MPQRKANYKNKARELALTVLSNYSEFGKTLDKVIENNSDKLDKLSREDRALLNYLVYGVIRWRARLDWIVRVLSKKSIDSMCYITLNIMRVGLYQIFFMNRIPNFAAVNTSVELAKKNKLSKKVSGYINAALRNAVRKSSLINDLLCKLNENSKNRLSVIKSFPEWILSRWIIRFGHDVTCDLCDIINTIPEIFIRTNSLKTTKGKLKTAVGNEAKNVEEFPYLPLTLKISGLTKPINKMRSFLDGMFSVQDAAAQIASYLLFPAPGELILDACSGLGNKSTHMAQLMNGQGKIVAVDNVKSKLEKLRDDASRLGIKIIETRHINLEIKIPKDFPLFDRIMLDAPCSSFGVIRRNPDIKWSSSLKKILTSSKKQLLLLENVSVLLKPQGVLLYVVCSTEPEESVDVINAFLEKNNNFKLDRRNFSKLDYLNSCLGMDGFFKTFPHIHNIDGFFMALLRRTH